MTRTELWLYLPFETLRFGEGVVRRVREKTHGVFFPFRIEDREPSCFMFIFDIAIQLRKDKKKTHKGGK